jgi:hypothetical protein
LFEAAAGEGSNQIKDDFKTNILDRLSNEWKEICQKASFDSLAVAWLIKYLDPRSYKVLGVHGVFSQRKQSVGNRKRGFVYLRRLVNEEPDKEDTLDTPILRLLRDAPSNPENIKNLAERITDSEAASDAFEHLVSGFDAYLLQLATEVYACIRRRHGANTHSIRHPGFFATWRVVKNIFPIPEIENWLINELNHCIPNNLYLLKEIYYFWLGSDKHSREERERPRLAIFNGLQSAWSQMPASSIGGGFDPSFPYTLFHLIFTSDYSKSSAVPLGAAEDWRWVGPILFEAINKNDHQMMAQVVIALDSIKRRGNENHSYELDEDTLTTWFPGRERQVVGLIATGFPIHPQIEAQTKYRLESAIRNAKVWLLNRSESEEPQDLKSTVCPKMDTPCETTP